MNRNKLHLEKAVILSPFSFSMQPGWRNGTILLDVVKTLDMRRYIPKSFRNGPWSHLIFLRSSCLLSQLILRLREATHSPALTQRIPMTHSQEGE